MYKNASDATSQPLNFVGRFFWIQQEKLENCRVRFIQLRIAQVRYIQLYIAQVRYIQLYIAQVRYIQLYMAQVRYIQLYIAQVRSTRKSSKKYSSFGAKSSYFYKVKM